MVFSCASLGDILAIAQLACTLAKTLSASRGSSIEYQELISELRSLSSVLEALHHQVSNQPPNRLHLEYSVENAIKFSLERCRSLMDDFRERIKGYEKALQKGGSGSKMRDSWRKMGWGIFKRDEVVELKNKLMEQKTSINLMLSFSNYITLERIQQYTDKQQAPITPLSPATEPISEKQGHHDTDVTTDLDHHAEQDTEKTDSEFLDTLSDNWRSTLAKHFQDALHSTAEGDGPFNIQEFLDEFSKALASEMRMSLSEIGKLRDEKRALEHEIGVWLSMKSKYGPGGEFDPDWKPSPLPPPTPPPEYPRPPAWRTVTQRSRRKKKNSPPSISIPPPPSASPGVASWMSWQPDPGFAPSPSPVGFSIPPHETSPGLFGPRSPRDSYFCM